MTGEGSIVPAAASIGRGYLAPELVRQRMRTLELLAPRAGEAVLDAGCGTGLLTEPLAREVGERGRVLAVDLDAGVLAEARARCAGLAQARLVQGRVEALPATDGEFHAAACTQVLLYVADVTAALAELSRVLAPGGRLVIVETDWAAAVLHSDDAALTRQLIAGWDLAVPSPNLPRRLRPLLLAAGFAAVRVEALPIVRTSVTGDDFVGEIIEWLARTAPERAGVTAEQAQHWRAGLWRLQEEGAFFFCVNRFLFSAVKR